MVFIKEQAWLLNLACWLILWFLLHGSCQLLCHLPCGPHQRSNLWGHPVLDCQTQNNKLSSLFISMHAFCYRNRKQTKTVTCQHCDLNQFSDFSNFLTCFYLQTTLWRLEGIMQTKRLSWKSPSVLILFCYDLTGSLFSLFYPIVFLLAEAGRYLSEFPVDSLAERTQPARHGDIPLILVLMLSSERPSLSLPPTTMKKNQKRVLERYLFPTPS